MITNYGERLLPSTFDQIAEADPDRLYALIPNSQQQSAGFRDLSFAQVAHSVNNFADHLENAFGCSQITETVSYLGIPDLRNAIAFLAAVKCGYKVCASGNEP